MVPCTCRRVPSQSSPSDAQPSLALCRAEFPGTPCVHSCSLFEGAERGEPVGTQNQEVPMSGGIIAVIVIVVIVVLAALVVTAASTRRRRLQQQFGPEYDRVVTEQSSRLRAEAELTDRQRRVRKLDIKPLSEDSRRKYAADWMTIQEQFVDAPQTAVRAAYELV